MFQNDDKEAEDFFDSHSYRMLKRYLCYIGQYPYQEPTTGVLHTFLLLLSIISATIPQLIRLGQAIKDYDIDLIISCLPALLGFSLSFVKLSTLQFNKAKFRLIFDMIKEQWRIITSEKERHILEEFAEKGNRFNQLYSGYVAAITCMFLLLPMAPLCIDIIFPRNESRSRNTLYPVEYYIDDKKYFYPIYIHSSCTAVSALFISVTVDSTFMLITHHACGLFALCRYHLQNITDLVDYSGEHTETVERLVYHELRECIITHKKAIGFTDIMATSSSTSYLVQIGINMIGVSVTGVQAVIKLHQLEEAARHGLFAISQNVHLFFITIPGQKLVNYSSDLSFNIYSAKWYKIPISMQKMLSIMHMRCEKCCKLSAGGLYDMNVENFGKIVKSSMSYFTMFLSLRE